MHDANFFLSGKKCSISAPILAAPLAGWLTGWIFPSPLAFSIAEKELRSDLRSSLIHETQ